MMFTTCEFLCFFFFFFFFLQFFFLAKLGKFKNRKYPKFATCHKESRKFLRGLFWQPTGTYCLNMVIFTQRTIPNPFDFFFSQKSFYELH
jgi:hypothetical protein